MARFTEKEHTAPVKLCDDKGVLNPDAKGWARVPLHICNLSGHYPKKKKWNFWLILNEDFAFSITVANVDYLGLGAAFLMDFKKGELFEDATVVPRPLGIDVKETVDVDATMKNKKMNAFLLHTPDTISIKVESKDFHGTTLDADILLQKPKGHETLNVVIPWGPEQFHFTSKQNTLPASGTVKVGDRTYTFDPAVSNGVLDFGRGIWPTNFIWNWAVFNHRQDGEILGMNLGSKWTDGTGATENGFCVNGRLFKISEDVVFTYDNTDFMKPWTMKTLESDEVDLTLTPVYQKASGGNQSQNNQVFGRFNGTFRAGDRKIALKNAFGWSEQIVGNW